MFTYASTHIAIYIQVAELALLAQLLAVVVVVEGGIENGGSGFTGFTVVDI